MSLRPKGRSSVLPVDSARGGGGGSGTGRECFQASCVVAAVVIVLLLVAGGPGLLLGESGSAAGLASGPAGGSLEAVSWNLAAINNNPFEYWITHEDEAYNQMMLDVQGFIDAPGDADVAVSTVFTDAMFEELAAEMTARGWEGVEETRAEWEANYRGRKIVSEFMKDAELGLKRLASMPDRTTNTISVEGGGFAFRPTPINCYGGEIKSMEDWWRQWRAFMFEQKLALPGKKGGPAVEVVPAQLLVPIKKAKYPAVSTEEERISIPLQALCGAIFDGILVHMLQAVAPAKWQSLRTEMCEALNFKKTHRTLEILETTYGDADVIFLQEVAASFVTKARASSSLQSRFHILAPAVLGKRDQNSVIMLRKATFLGEDFEEVTALVEQEFVGQSVPVATGDVFALLAKGRASAGGAEETFLLASFHGDTNGLATIPVVGAVRHVMDLLAREGRGEPQNEGARPTLLFGLDANTYEFAKPGKTQDVLEFAQSYRSQSLTSCWSDPEGPDPTVHTTFNARTFLQPQLNKAARKDQLVSKGDVNPKDFILFSADTFEVLGVTKDNTGRRVFTENMVFPTLEFPSDHGVLSTKLRRVGL